MGKQSKDVRAADSPGQGAGTGGTRLARCVLELCQHPPGLCWAHTAVAQMQTHISQGQAGPSRPQALLPTLSGRKWKLIICII